MPMAACGFTQDAQTIQAGDSSGIVRLVTQATTEQVTPCLGHGKATMAWLLRTGIVITTFGEGFILGLSSGGGRYSSSLLTS
jgi:hypothetical protein